MTQNQDNTTEKKPTKWLVRLPLIIAIVIFLTLLAINIPPLLRSHRRVTPLYMICYSNLKTIALGVLMYRCDDEKNPPSLQILLEEEILRESSYLVCPAVRSNRPEECSYVYRGSDLPEDCCLDSLPSSNDIILAYCKYYHEEGRRTLAFADGRVEIVSEEEFQKTIDQDNQLRRKMGLREKPAKLHSSNK